MTAWLTSPRPPWITTTDPGPDDNNHESLHAESQQQQLLLNATQGTAGITGGGVVLQQLDKREVSLTGEKEKEETGAGIED